MNLSRGSLACLRDGNSAYAMVFCFPRPKVYCVLRRKAFEVKWKQLSLPEKRERRTEYNYESYCYQCKSAKEMEYRNPAPKRLMVPFLRERRGENPGKPGTAAIEG